MAFHFYLSANTDTRPTLVETFTDPAGSPVNLTGYTVTAAFRHMATGTTAAPSVAITTAASGIVTVTFAAGDLVLPGGWEYQFKCVGSGGAPTFHVPNDGYKVAWVTTEIEDLATSLTNPYYPTAADLWQWLEGHGLTVSSTWQPQLRHAAEAGRDQFERLAQRKMLAPTATAVRYFTPPLNADGLLFLAEAGGFDSDLASFTSLAYQPEGATAQTLTNNTDFTLLPLNAAAQGRPYTRVKFTRRWMGPLSVSQQRAIRITGRWGYGTALPSDVFEGMLALAGTAFWARIRQTVTGGRLSISEQDVKEDFGVEPWSQLQAGWRDLGAGTARRYARWTL